MTGKDDSESRVTGAWLLVRAPAGMSSDELARALQCHGAKALLGQLDPAELPRDPFVLPGAWLDISVKPEAGNLAVYIQTDTTFDALNEVQKATAFAETHGAAVVERP
jgi:hypothetical protein